MKKIIKQMIFMSFVILNMQCNVFTMNKPYNNSVWTLDERKTILTDILKKKQLTTLSSSSVVSTDNTNTLSNAFLIKDAKNIRDKINNIKDLDELYAVGKVVNEFVLQTAALLKNSQK